VLIKDRDFAWIIDIDFVGAFEIIAEFMAWDLLHQTVAEAAEASFPLKDLLISVDWASFAAG